MTGVSVVMPTYNRAAYIDASLRAVLAQTLAPMEVIVVDDASKDDTRAVCERFGSAVRYIWQENKGPAAARNTGIAASRGEWIAFCDSDDVWYPRKLEVQLAATRAVGADWSITGFGLIDPDDGRITVPHLGFERSFAVFDELRLGADEHFGGWLELQHIDVGSETLRVYVGDAFGMLFHGNVALPSTTLMSRAAIERGGVFNEGFRYAEDTEWFHRISASTRMAIIMSALADYRVGHPSVMSAHDLSPQIRGTLASIDMAARLRAPLSAAEESAYREGRRLLRTRLAYHRLSAYDGREARQVLRDAWRSEGRLSPKDLAIAAVSFMPAPLLRALHSAKRRLRG